MSVFSLIILVALKWKALGKKEKFPLFLFGFLYMSMALTLSRSTYLAYLVAMGVIAFLKKTPRFFLLVVLLGALTLMIIPQPSGEGGKLGRRYSIEARIQNWQNSSEIIKDNLLHRFCHIMNTNSFPIITASTHICHNQSSTLQSCDTSIKSCNAFMFNAEPAFITASFTK